MKSLFKAVFILTIFTIITRFMGFVFHVYLSRSLGAQMTGQFHVASGIISILLTIVSSGIPLTTAKMSSQYTTIGDFKKKHQAAGSALVIALIASIVISSLVYCGQGLLKGIFADQSCMKLIIVMLPAVIYSAIYAVLRGVMWGESRFFAVSITEVFEQVVRIVLTIVLLNTLKDKTQSTMVVAKAFSIACLSSALLATILFFRTKNKLAFSRGEYAKVLKSSAAITGIRLTNSLSMPVCSIILPAQLIAMGISQSQAMSLYGSMVGMALPLMYIPMSIVGSLGMALVPNLASQMSKKNYQSIRNNLVKSFDLVLFLSCVFIPIFLSVGGEITYILYKDQMSGILLEKSFLLVLLISLSGITNSILNGMGLETKSFWHYLVGLGSIAVILLSCTRLLGIDAIILALCASYICIIALNIRLLHKNIPQLNIELGRKLAKYALICLITTLFGKWTHNLLINILPAFISMLIVCAIIGVIYCILCAIFGLQQIKRIMLIKRKA